MPPLLRDFSVFILLALSCHAEIFTIDFEDLTGACNSSIVGGGMKITNARGTICLHSGYGTNSVVNETTVSNDSEGLKVVNVNGKPFTPISIDIGEYSMSVRLPNPILITGTMASGETVHFTVSLDGIRDGAGGADDFQTISFPEDFTGVVSVEFPEELFSFDNIVISGNIPPPLPSDQKVATGFLTAELIGGRSLLESKFVAGPDYFYQVQSGYFLPKHALYHPGSSSQSFSSIEWPSYDLESSTLLFTNSSGIQSFDGITQQTLYTAAQLQDAGYPDYRLTRPWLNDKRILFIGTRTKGGDAYAIFALENNVLTPLLTKQSTLLSGSAMGQPYHFPNLFVASARHFSFDTSVSGSTSTSRILASFDRGPIQLIASEGDDTPLGKITDFESLAFNSDNQLEIVGVAGSTKCRMKFNQTTLISIEPTILTVAPINAGKLISGLANDPNGEILDCQTEIYRKFGSQWYWVIGAGDLIDGELVTSAKFLARRRDHPNRIIVEIRKGSSFESYGYHYELELGPVGEVPPRFGSTTIHSESRELYIPLSHLTHGRQYIVTTSSDLKTWIQLQEVTEIFPIQHVIIPVADLHNPSFFRVEEKR